MPDWHSMSGWKIQSPDADRDGATEVGISGLCRRASISRRDLRGMKSLMRVAIRRREHLSCKQKRSANRRWPHRRDLRGEPCRRSVRRQMSRVERYVLRTGATAFLTGLVVLTGVIWITQALRQIDLLTSKGQTILIFLMMTGLALALARRRSSRPSRCLPAFFIP